MFCIAGELYERVADGRVGHDGHGLPLQRHAHTVPAHDQLLPGNSATLQSLLQSSPAKGCP